MTLTRTLLVLLLLIAAALGLCGLDWGLPTRVRLDSMLPEATADDFQRIARGGTETAEPPTDDDTIIAERAQIKIYFRTLTHTHHPDEYMVLKALHGLPRFDPGVYRYGGPMLVGTGAFLAAGRVLGLVTLTGDTAWYLDHPEEFARLYLAARLFVLAMVLLGVYAAFRLGRLFGGDAAGLLSAAIFLIMPATVNWSHIAKPHLPAIGLVLLAAEMAIRYVRSEDASRAKLLILSSVFAGLAAAFVLSFAPAALIPAAAAVTVADRRRLGRTVLLLGLCAVIFIAAVLVTNPWYVTHYQAVAAEARFISADVAQRYVPDLPPVQRAIGSAGGFFLRLLPLAMSWPVALLGLAAGLVALVKSREARLLAPAWLAVAAMAAWSVGLSGEPNVARFALMPAALLIPAIAAVTVRLVRDTSASRIGLPLAAILLGIPFVLPYLAVYRADSRPDNSRQRTAADLTRLLSLDRSGESPLTLGTIMPPAAYNLPPVPLKHFRVQGLPEMHVPPEADLPEFLLVDSVLAVRRPDGWWQDYYEQVATLPLPAPSAAANAPGPPLWSSAPMSTADFSFQLLRRK